MRKPTQKKPPSAATHALANFCAPFWQNALRIVEARMDAEDSGKRKHKKREAVTA